MKLLSDDEMFGMIPQADGSHKPGNMPLFIYPSLKSTYLNKLQESGVFPEQIQVSYRYNPDVRGEKAQMRSHAGGNLLIPIYKDAFLVAEEIIEDHSEETNGFIRSFPPSKLDVYPNMERKFEYFDYAPKDYVPAAEERLKKAYANIHQDCALTFRGKAIWFVLATLAFALVLLGGRIYTLIPQLGAWASESQLNFYIQIGIILLFLEIIGCFVPGSWLDVDFNRHTFGYLVMMGAIFAFGYLYFPGTNGPAPEDGAVRVIYFLIKWPYIGYFAIVWIYYAVCAISALTELLRYRKNLNSYKKDFARIYEEDIHRFHRYVRLRRLWMEHEKVRSAYWVNTLERRLYQYREEYSAMQK